MVPPAPAVFSSSRRTGEPSLSASARRRPACTRSRPASKPEPMCEPMWVTIASAPSWSAAARAPISDVTDFS